MLKNNIFHRFEMAFSGYSGSGKSTLAQSLIKKMSDRFKLAYVKHDAHHFEMDKEGKDTYKAYQSGASLVSISNDEKWADQGVGQKDKGTLLTSYLEYDFVLVEGHKKEKLPKLIILGEVSQKDQILSDWQEGLLENVLGFVGPNNEADFDTKELPYFQRDELDKIELFILNYFSKIMENTPVYGLILAGGRSTRMKTDKGAIKYFGKSQTQKLKELLSPHCEKVLVSCRQDQEDADHMQGLELLPDSILDMGPMGGILSAMRKYPNVAFMVVACDLPYLEKGTLDFLFKERNPYKMATCFLNPERRWPEPLCTIYEPKSYQKLLQYLSIGYSCPRKVLFNGPIKSMELNFKEALNNANTPDDYKMAKEFIAKNQEVYQ